MGGREAALAAKAKETKKDVKESAGNIVAEAKSTAEKALRETAGTK